jgi:hypothetical protein
MEVETPAVPIAAPEVVQEMEVEDMEVEIPTVPVQAPEVVEEIPAVPVQAPEVVEEMEVEIPAVPVQAPEVVEEMVEIPAVSVAAPEVGKKMFCAELINRGIDVIGAQVADLNCPADELQRVVKVILTRAVKSMVDEDNVPRDLTQHFLEGCDIFCDQVRENRLQFLDLNPESEWFFNLGSKLAVHRSLDQELTGGSSGSGQLSASNLSNILKELRTGRTQKGAYWGLRSARRSLTRSLLTIRSHLPNSRFLFVSVSSSYQFIPVHTISYHFIPFHTI